MLGLRCRFSGKKRVYIALKSIDDTEELGRVGRCLDMCYTTFISKRNSQQWKKMSDGEMAMTYLTQDHWAQWLLYRRLAVLKEIERREMRRGLAYHKGLCCRKKTDLSEWWDIVEFNPCWRSWGLVSFSLSCRSIHSKNSSQIACFWNGWIW